MLGLDNADKRRGLRSIVQAIVALAIVGLVAWIIHLVRTEAQPLERIALALIAIVALGTLGYIAENVTRAIKLKTPLGEASIGDSEEGA